ncbi:hypothetical protein [Mycolicibacterium monacense]|uniref:PH domain-containing protein n=2 Tax=Mycobacteriaceae TaxID=1762 RepID=A0AAD1J1X5_MYCMB|nr:hypothetical protein [Mycolicibacterium monacense]MDA4100377.1 hypothetical protein [Mycolicibacterium monacense DSM 44395]ORB21334.1 hypothetical protein BST34_09525 [Mycolicibacterium monacense DSM 44395]QHP84654.1 hypothetical protein EWR22_04305 [Mycolicibacterium monacense DSM 44395]BBZ62566.1 hypothetical protein MMON_38670 [Mycolicibacterium monacense]
MPVLNLPEPDAWQRARTRYRWLFAFGFLLIGFGLEYAVSAAVRGSYPTAVFFLLLAASPLPVAVGMARASYGFVPYRVRCDATGTTVLPDRWMAVFGFVSLLAFIATAVLYNVLYFTGTLDMSTSSMSRRASPYAFAVVVILVVGRLAVGWRRRNGWGYVRLTLAGVENTDVIRTKFYAWGDIDDVLDAPEKKRTRKAVVLALKDGSEVIIEGADLYVPRGVGLYWMVRHYWRHPEDRAELTDGRAHERLIEERFDVD